MWPRGAKHSLEGHRLEMFDLEPPQNSIKGEKFLVTCYQSLGYVLDNQGFESCRFKSYESFPNVRTTYRFHTACSSTRTGLCLEMNRAGVGRAVNWYWIVFGTE